MRHAASRRGGDERVHDRRHGDGRRHHLLRQRTTAAGRGGRRDPRRAGGIVARPARVAEHPGTGSQAAARGCARKHLVADADARWTVKSSDTRFEILIGRVLRTGVVTSIVCLAIGLPLSLAWPEPGAGARLLNIGILFLIATPAARVVLSTIEYILERDWPFAVLTSIVLVELVIGAVAALVFHRRI
ncbi:MAG: hypothetical protein DMG01_19090 [Acidobacteria bacterium]|nr:MAG: hypothetical protein DMG01_19090 [Acidobacteriota bacterium]